MAKDGIAQSHVLRCDVASSLKAAGVAYTEIVSATPRPELCVCTFQRPGGMSIGTWDTKLRGRP